MKPITTNAILQAQKKRVNGTGSFDASPPLDSIRARAARSSAVNPAASLARIESTDEGGESKSAPDCASTDSLDTRFTLVFSAASSIGSSPPNHFWKATSRWPHKFDASDKSRFLCYFRRAAREGRPTRRGERRHFHLSLPNVGRPSKAVRNFCRSRQASPIWTFLSTENSSGGIIGHFDKNMSRRKKSAT